MLLESGVHPTARATHVGTIRRLGVRHDANRSDGALLGKPIDRNYNCGGQLDPLLPGQVVGGKKRSECKSAAYGKF